jgi:drug/metabolite transporter (DMT)-like permease
LLLGERISPVQAVGGVLILAAAVLTARASVGRGE